LLVLHKINIMEFTAQTIAEFLNGDIVGNPQVKVNNISKIEEGTEGTLTFLANQKYTNFIYSTKASIVLVNRSFIPEKNIEATIIKVDDAYSAFASLMELVAKAQENNRKGIEPNAYIHPSAKIGKNAYIASFSYIDENVTIGDDVHIQPNTYIGKNTVVGNNCLFYSGVKVYYNSVIGNNCIFHSGVVIGSDGFGFAPNPDKSYKKIPQIGNVIIEDDVEVGANTCIDRAALGSTIIRKGVKLDNLIQIAHNVEIGEHTVIAALTGISGSTKIGAYCLIGGQVGFAGHLTVANNTRIGAQAGIDASVKTEGTVLIGSPAINFKDYYRSYVIFKNLPDLDKKIRVLEQKQSEQNKGE